MDAEAAELFAEGSDRRSDFFRDLAGSRYLSLAEEAAAQRDPVRQGAAALARTVAARGIITEGGWHVRWTPDAA